MNWAQQDMFVPFMFVRSSRVTQCYICKSIYTAGWIVSKSLLLFNGGSISRLREAVAIMLVKLGYRYSIRNKCLHIYNFGQSLENRGTGGRTPVALSCIALCCVASPFQSYADMTYCVVSRDDHENFTTVRVHSETSVNL
jgi:hypothetical protein